MIDFAALRTANNARQVEWPVNEEADLEFRALEVADEAGEVIGAVKKLLRARRGIAGSTLDVQAVADEIGDTIVSLDLLANQLGLDLIAPVQSPNSSLPLPRLTLRLHTVSGDLTCAMEDFLNEAAGEEGNYYLAEFMASIVFWLTCIAADLNIDPGKAVIEKFNKTSEKYGLATRL